MIYIYQDDTAEKTLIISSLDNCKKRGIHLLVHKQGLQWKKINVMLGPCSSSHIGNQLNNSKVTLIISG